MPGRRVSPRQRIRLLRTPDGASLAWAEAGTGPVLVRAATWLTHLEFDWESPVWRHWLEFLAGNFRLIRYDERGCGMSDRDVEDLSFRRWFDDFDAVVDVACPDRPFILLGISQGGATAIEYAARNPDRVSHLVLCGAYAQGWRARGRREEIERYEAIVKLTRLGWGQDNSTYRQVFTSRFVPDASAAQIGWFNDLCRRTASPATAARLLEERGRVDVSALLPKVRVPTLVLHAEQDEVVPLRQGLYIASRIPGARFVQLDSRNHVLLENEPAWTRFREEVLAFTASGMSADTRFEMLTPRERDVLDGMARGLANAAIADELGISEKTVRNHVTRIFDKLSVKTRPEAIVLALGAGRKR